MSRLRTALLLLAGLAAAAPAQADPVGVDDLILLLEGGVGEKVILRHVQRWGLERDLEAADLVALRKAGATDDLLEDLAARMGGSEAGQRALPLPEGRGVLLTNLDEEGRRLGGEVPEPTPFNRVGAPGAGREAAPPVPDGAEWERSPVSVIIAGADPEAISGAFGARAAGLERDYPRLGTPGGYTRYKLYYSRAPESGFRTWVFPVFWLTRSPVFGTLVQGGFVPPVIVF